MLNSISNTDGFYNNSLIFGANGGCNSLSNGFNANRGKNLAARMLKDVASTLSSPKDSKKPSRQFQSYKSEMWDQVKAVSSDDSIATASLNGKTAAPTYSIEVINVAKAQEEKSEQLSSNQPTNVEAGKHNLTVQVGGKSYNITVDISSKDTNDDVFNKIAAALNKSNSGLTADVVKKNNKSQLVIAGKTGEENGFSIEGQKFSQLLKMRKTQAAEDAAYSIGGKRFTSSSNSVTIENGSVTINFKSTGNAKISMVIDDNGTMKSITEFAENFNDSQKKLSKMEDSEEASKIKAMLAMSAFTLDQFSKIGVVFDSNGQMSINQKTLASAIQNDPERVKKLFSDLANQTQKAFSNATYQSGGNSDSGLMFDYSL